MMTYGCRATRLLIAGLVVSALVLGCSRTPPTRFFMLMPASSMDSTAAGSLSGANIGVGPVLVAQYLDRPQIVSRKSRSELHVAEFSQWAEPLAPNIGRVLVENLSQHMSGVTFTLLPLRQIPALDYEIKVRVLRLDAGPDGTARLDAEWGIVRGRDVLTQQRKSFETPVGEDASAIVEAQSLLLADLSRALAVSLVATHANAPSDE